MDFPLIHLWILPYIHKLIYKIFWGLQESKTSTSLRNVFCVLVKSEKGWWKRLLKGEGKPPLYLKVDWDKWVDEDEEDTEGSKCKCHFCDQYELNIILILLDYLWCGMRFLHSMVGHVYAVDNFDFTGMDDFSVWGYLLHLSHVSALAFLMMLYVYICI